MTYRCSNGLMKDFRNELELVTEELDDVDKYAIVCKLGRMHDIAVERMLFSPLTIQTV